MCTDDRNCRKLSENMEISALKLSDIGEDDVLYSNLVDLNFAHNKYLVAAGCHQQNSYISGLQ